MRGGLKLADRGVIPRLLSGVFRRGKKIMKETEGETTVHVSLSYYEIYNDKVFDLLEPPENRTPMGLPLRAEANGKTVVCGLTERTCEDLRDFEKLYIEANNNRVTAATKLNAHSSRSHAILRVKLTQISGGSIKESTASAIDLAGSEDNRRTENNRERLVESAAINKSLFVLSQCIDAISRGDKRIPYRESKMTRILSLGQNNGITVMILNLAPLRSYHLDTLSSLNVSSRAKRIEVREIENEVVFKQMPRSNSGLSGTKSTRQPLRPLANAMNSHNVHSGNVAAKAAETTKPVKAFSVYTDELKPIPSSRPSLATSSIRRSSMLKRPSEVDNTLRPSKIARPSLLPTSASMPMQTMQTMQTMQEEEEETVTMSAKQIEAMVEKKVGELLAARIAAEKSNQAQMPPPPQPDVNESMQRRLEALERRLESEEWRDDAKSDGLRFLLAARQHKERGDDAAALKSYESALPFFPGQAKLLGKISRLRTRLGLPDTEDVSNMAKPDRKRRRTSRFSVACDDDTVAFASGATTMLFPQGIEPLASPKSQRLLDVINSRDVAQIRSLPGFGVKMARDVVGYLEMADDEDGGYVGSIDQLRTMPGMEDRLIDRAYGALAA